MLGEILSLISALSWALAPVFYRMGMEKVSPIVGNAIRSIPVTFFMLAYVVFLGKSVNFEFIFIFYIFLTAFLGLVVGDTMYMKSLKEIGVSRTVPITSTYPLFTAILASIFLKEKLTIGVLLGTVLIVFGIAFISKSKDEKVKNLKKGVAFSVTVSIIWSVTIIVLGFLIKYFDVFSLNAIRMVFVSTITSLFSLSFKKNEFLNCGKKIWFILGLGGFLAMGVGNITFYKALSHSPASVVTPLSSVSPVFSAAIAVLFLRERINKAIGSGTFLTLAGIFFVLFFE